MQRCIDLGKLALGTARPNPMVGCVIVHENRIIGEGFTAPYGGPHAEVAAIRAVKDKSKLEEAILYVCLEPCSHFGKTPPCANLIVDSGIRHVVIGCKDPNSKVSGKGIEILKQGGCRVELGILEQECREHLKRFLCYHEKKRPYIILKWAETSDGFIAPLKKDRAEPVWISSETSRQLVHKWRSQEQAILVGHNTVKEDNPSLNTRNWPGQDPVKIILTKEDKLDRDLNIFKNDPPVVLDSGKINYNNPVAAQLCDVLFHEGITSVLVEGGSKTLNHFINSGLWDEARVFIGSVIFKEGIHAPVMNRAPLEEQDIGGDHLLLYRND